MRLRRNTEGDQAIHLNKRNKLDSKSAREPRDGMGTMITYFLARRV